MLKGFLLLRRIRMFSFLGFLSTVALGIILDRMFSKQIDMIVNKFLGAFKKNK